MYVPKRTMLAAAAALFLAPGLASAQQSNTPQPGGGPSAEMQSVVKEYRSVAQKLQGIRKKAIEANPELKEKRKDFQNKVETAMADSGYDVESNRQRVQEIGEKLKSGDVEKSERQKLMKDLRSKQQKMRKAQQSAMQKPEVQAAGQELQKQTLAAMRDQDSQTDELLDRMKELRSKLQSMQQNARGGAPGGGAPAAGGSGQ